MTNGWVDIKNADVILAMGGNPAENHPVGFKWFIEARKVRGAKIVAVDPRFTRTAAVADLYAPLRSGTDIAFLLGIIRYAIDKKRFHEEYVKLHTNASYVISDKYRFDSGLFAGFDATKGEYAKDAWAYEADEQTKAYKVDPSLEHPRCVFQLLKKHVDRYTPEMVERICGTPQDTFLKVCDVVTSTGTADRAGTITYALGWTQHSTGVQMIRGGAMLQLLLGNVGRPGGGVNAFRGHSNIQGATDTAGTFEILPGYLKTPTGAQQTLQQYYESAVPTTLNKQAWASMNYWTNYPKFMVSLLKAVWGKAATPDNEFGYAWLPKIDGNYSWMYIFDDMYRGSATRAGGKEPGPEGLISFGMNPVGLGPNSKKMVSALSKLKWMVVVENVETETSIFWKAPPQYEPPPPSQIDTEVFLLPAANFAEKDGTFTNSARWLQWKWKAVEPPRQAKADQTILARLVLAVRDLYRKEGGPSPEPILNLSWSYSNPADPDLGEVLKEMNGKALADVYEEAGPRKVEKDAKGTGNANEKDGKKVEPEPAKKGEPEPPKKILRTAGQQLDGFAQLRDDGSTMCGNWLHSGVYTEAGNNAQRRNTADPTGLGMFPTWAFSWPANRRVMYNRASADAEGRPWDPSRSGIAWNGERWVGDVADTNPTAPPGTYGAFIMLPEGVGRLFSSALNDGPFPEHYEAVEAPVDNPLHPKVTSNPVSKRFSTDRDIYGKKEDFPIVCTTYRLTEHFHYWTQHQHGGLLNQVQPGFFIELPEGLAQQKGIANGSQVKVISARGEIQGVAMVTKRLRPLVIDGKETWQIGFPIHWGYAGAKNHTGPLANLLTPSAMDPNTWTPEYKAFLVRVEKA
jgi:formate dehydrogenase major subunit